MRLVSSFRDGDGFEHLFGRQYSFACPYHLLQRLHDHPTALHLTKGFEVWGVHGKSLALCFREEGATLGEMAEAQDARNQAAEINDFISKNTDLWGRPRKQADEADRIRKRVSKRIHEAIDHIRSAGHEALAQHLDGCLKTGFDCVYGPKPTIRWMT